MSDQDEELLHYGTPRHSGRYPWGSGKDPQRSTDFAGHIRDLKRQGLTEKQIAESMGMSINELRAKKSIARSEKRRALQAQAVKLKDAGMSTVAIGKEMHLNESSVRALLDPTLHERAEITETVSNVLRDRVDKVGYLDVGSGVENHLGISRTKLDTALALLKEEGYEVHPVLVEQLGTGKKTIVKTLVTPGVSAKDAYHHREEIKMMTDYSEDGGRSFLGLEPIRSISSSKISIRYGDEGGSDKDGVIELRRGVPELSLDQARYAQVRIGVDGTHYMKGMAIYTDNMPQGFDVIYNTNKPKGTPAEKVFKSVKDDPDNPFGSVVRQKHYIDPETGKKELSALNIVYQEGKWNEWSRSISSQVLSKQSPALAKKQLREAFDRKQDEFDEIMSLTNPAVKAVLLKPFADGCDSSAVKLKAAALPRQSSHVILPLTHIKPTEIYAPNYENGEPVVLIRHPHGGIFEIPELIVNNRNPEGKSVLGDARDAVGIHPSVAQKLSGADFDGDTVLVIPNRDRNIRTAKSLPEFDPKVSYTLPDDAPKMKPKTKQMEMGKVSNLITDMTIKGATLDEVERAVRHSMVVIDAEKHHLDYKRSYQDHNIAELKRKYQGREDAGAATLISRASSDVRVDHRKEKPGVAKIDPETGKQRGGIDPVTGKKIFEYTGETYVRPTGPFKRDPKTGKKVYLTDRTEVVKRTLVSKKMLETDDAHTLSSGTRMENVYADHANSLKNLANRARLALLNIEPIPYSPSAKAAYHREVEVLKAKLDIASRNKPLERQAQIVANRIVRAKKEANPQMEAADLKKIKGQALTEARARVGAGKDPIEITDREWEAIQSGAISNNLLIKILENAKLDDVKQRAMPRTYRSLSPARVTRAKNMLAAGSTRAEVAQALGISPSTLDDALE